MTEKMCPESRESLGRKTWGLLHSIAAHYPAEPSEASKQNYLDFFESFPYAYPCRPCAKDFQELTQQHPPEVDSREKVQLWLCKMHNLVNKRLDKSEFPCTIKDLELRWKKGPPECYPEQKNTEETNIVF